MDQIFRPKILFFERDSVSPDGLDLSPIEKCGNVMFFDADTEDERCTAARDADILIINKTKIGREFLRSCPRLKCICLLATGYNNVDLHAAREFGVAVCNVPDYSTDAVAQLVFSFLLHFATKLSSYDLSVKEGRWINCGIYTYYDWPIFELKGKTIGIIGYGHIGRRVAALSEAFGMRILVYTRNPGSVAPPAVACRELGDLLSGSDFVTLHCPLTEATKGMINRETLARMKPSAYLINTSRGAVVDEEALTEALNSGRIAGAGIDVLETEPMRPDSPYLSSKNLLITPHIGWAAQESRARLVTAVAENISAFLQGRKINRVDITG